MPLRGCLGVKIMFNVCVDSKPTRFAGDADAIRSPNELHGLFINPHQSDGVDEGNNLTVEAARSDLKTKEERRD